MADEREKKDQEIGKAIEAEKAHVGSGVRGLTLARKRKVWEEQGLVEGLRSGEEAVIEKIMKKHQKKLFSVSLRICKNVDDAEEVLQDVYMIMRDRIDQFQGNSSPFTWLYRITVNASLMKLRQEKKNRQMLSLNENVNPSGIHRISSPFERPASPTDVLLRSERWQLIHDAAESLPEKYQHVFYMRDIYGLTIKETSRVLDITLATTKSRLHRCRSHIKERIRDRSSVVG